MVEVNHAPKRDYSVLFEITMGIAYESFNSSSVQRRFVEKLAALFHDQDTNNILIRSIRHIHHSGNTLITFYNTTLHRQHNKCPEHQIQKLKNILLHQDSSIRDLVKEMLGIEYNILKINLVPIGTCQNYDTIHHEFVPTKTNDNDMEIYKEDYLLTYIVPASIILIMLLISFFITCILYKRRQSGKVELGDEEERKSFRSKGIPVIFQDELDEKPEMTNNPPIILKNEKPPLLSQYGNGNGINTDGK